MTYCMPLLRPRPLTHGGIRGHSSAVTIFKILQYTSFFFFKKITNPTNFKVNSAQTHKWSHEHTMLPDNISQPLGSKIDGIKLLLSRFFIRIYRRFCTQSFPAPLPSINHVFFFILPLYFLSLSFSHWGLFFHPSTHRCQTCTKMYTQGLSDMSVTRWMTSSTSAAKKRILSHTHMHNNARMATEIQMA